MILAFGGDRSINRVKRGVGSSVVSSVGSENSQNRIEQQWLLRCFRFIFHLSDLSAIMGSVPFGKVFSHSPKDESEDAAQRMLNAIIANKAISAKMANSAPISDLPIVRKGIVVSESGKAVDKALKVLNGGVSIFSPEEIIARSKAANDLLAQNQIKPILGRGDYNTYLRNKESAKVSLESTRKIMQELEQKVQTYEALKPCADHALEMAELQRSNKGVIRSRQEFDQRIATSTIFNSEQAPQAVQANNDSDNGSGNGGGDAMEPPAKRPRHSNEPSPAKSAYSSNPKAEAEEKEPTVVGMDGILDIRSERSSALE